MTDVSKRIDELVEGDLVDLCGDRIADQPTDEPDHDVCRSAYEFEYAVVDGTERETPECIRVDFTNTCSVGFPPDHRVPVHIPTERNP